MVFSENINSYQQLIICNNVRYNLHAAQLHFSIQSLFLDKAALINYVTLKGGHLFCYGL